MTEGAEKLACPTRLGLAPLRSCQHSASPALTAHLLYVGHSSTKGLLNLSPSKSLEVFWVPEKQVGAMRLLF